MHFICCRFVKGGSAALSMLIFTATALGAVSIIAKVCAWCTCCLPVLLLLSFDVNPGLTCFLPVCYTFLRLYVTLLNPVFHSRKIKNRKTRNTTVGKSYPRTTQGRFINMLARRRGEHIHKHLAGPAPACVHAQTRARAHRYLWGIGCRRGRPTIVTR